MSTTTPRRSARIAAKAAPAAAEPSAAKPRRSARIAAKAAPAAPKPSARKPAAPKENKASSAIELIRTTGSDDPMYYYTGYSLYRSNGKFEIICTEHGSECNTRDIVEGYDSDDDFELTLDQVIRLATNKSDPRVPDVATDNPHLLALYKSILEHKDVLQTWVSTDPEAPYAELATIYVAYSHYFFYGK